MTENAIPTKKITAWQKMAYIAFLILFVYGIFHAINKRHEQEDPTASIGQAVRDNNFQFIVNGFSCGHKDYGWLSPTPQGQYCLLEIAVKNTANEPHHWYGDVKLYDVEKREYTKKKVIHEEPTNINAIMNPGNSISGTLVYDVPKEAQLVRAKLNDAFSQGVNVRLRN